jgi:hypothetical protein
VFAQQSSTYSLLESSHSDLFVHTRNTKQDGQIEVGADDRRRREQCIAGSAQAAECLAHGIAQALRDGCLIEFI